MKGAGGSHGSWNILLEFGVEAIEARDLPEKFFFWFTRSAAEWAKLGVHVELYGGLWDTWKQIAATSPAIAAHFGGRVPVISFGAGDGARDRLLMGALKDAGCECSYFPVDASQTMLEMACAGADDEDIETVGIKADISSPVHLIYAADAAEPPPPLHPLRQHHRAPSIPSPRSVTSPSA